jgi:hypothetical protein
VILAIENHSYSSFKKGQLVLDFTDAIGTVSGAENNSLVYSIELIETENSHHLRGAGSSKNQERSTDSVEENSPINVRRVV